MDNFKLIQDQYFKWLCGIVNTEQPFGSYWLLASLLHREAFIWSVPNDDNRIDDGIKLRTIFCDEYNFDDHDRTALSGKCTFFEVLVGLSYRIEEQMNDDNTGQRISKWFWEMCENLSLTAYTDETLAEPIFFEHALNIVSIVNNRTYCYDGTGGLFPLKNPRQDQRTVELWYQMCTYLMENYFTDF